MSKCNAILLATIGLCTVTLCAVPWLWPESNISVECPTTTYTPADPAESCRRMSTTMARVRAGEVMDDCDRRNLLEASEEIHYLERSRELESGYCWDELEICESGVASERACRGYLGSRFDQVIEDLEACARCEVEQ